MTKRLPVAARAQRKRDEGQRRNDLVVMSREQ
jgi:hypothetical protein